MSPAVIVRTALEAARRAGVDFATAWWAVLQTVEDERWRETLAQTAGTWKRAYMLEPATEGDRAIDALSRGIAGELADLDADAHCPVCDGVVVQGPQLRRHKVYCSHACQRIANGRREPLDVAA